MLWTLDKVIGELVVLYLIVGVFAINCSDVAAVFSMILIVVTAILFVGCRPTCSVVWTNFGYV